MDIAREQVNEQFHGLYVQFRFIYFPDKFLSEIIEFSSALDGKSSIRLFIIFSSYDRL